MKRLLILMLACSLVLPAAAQNRIGFDAGAGWCYIKNQQYYPGHYKFATDPDICLGVHYLRRMNRHVYIGARLIFQQYTFSYTFDQADSIQRNGGEIATKASYVFLAPTLDIGIDNSQICHVYISGAYGDLIHGTQKNHTYTYNAVGPFYDNSFRTDGEINKSVTRIDIGLCQHIPINPDWYVTINESYCMLQSSMTTLDNPSYTPFAIRPSYFCITAGIAYKLLYTGWITRYVDDED